MTLGKTVERVFGITGREGWVATNGGKWCLPGRLALVAKVGKGDTVDMGGNPKYALSCVLNWEMTVFLVSGSTTSTCSFCIG